MNPYTTLSSGVGSREAADLGARLSAWHDAMVAHERRLRAGATSDSCSDECAHAEARLLWAESVATLGARAQELTFLRSRAQHARRSVRNAGPARTRAAAAEYGRSKPPESSADTTALVSVAPAVGATELES